MSFYEDHQHFKGAIVMKITIDGKVKVNYTYEDGIKTGISVSHKFCPDLILELHHTHHKFHDTTKIRLTFEACTEIDALIALLQPGSFIKSISRPPEKGVKIVLTDGKACEFLASAIRFKHLKK